MVIRERSSLDGGTGTDDLDGEEGTDAILGGKGKDFCTDDANDCVEVEIEDNHGPGHS